MFRLYFNLQAATLVLSRSGQILRKAFKHFFFAAIFCASIFSVQILADDPRGEVIRVDGCVHIIDAEGNRQTVEQPGRAIRESDTIVTEVGANAIIRFDDGVLSVLDEKSRLRVEKTSWLSHLGGRIYFTYRKIFKGKRQVKTRFATLGIRGTTFIVYDDDDGQSVALQEGELNVESKGEAFEIFKQQQVDEFEAYKQEVQQQEREFREEFDEYRKQLSREFVEYRDSFTMQPNQIVRFDGRRVSESMIDDAIEADFDNFELIAGELLEQFREQAGQHRQRLQDQQLVDDDDFYE